MSESPDEKEKRELRELEGKNIAHFSVLLDAWIQTRMEHDKSLLALASGGIALLVTLLTTVGINNLYEIFLYFCAILGFGISIWSTLTIYQKNSEILELELQKKDCSKLNLKKYDILTFWSFMVGVAFACLIGIVAAVGEIYSTGDNHMAEDKKRSTFQREIVKESFDGISRLRPESPVQDQGQSQSPQEQNVPADSSQDNGKVNNSND